MATTLFEDEGFVANVKIASSPLRSAFVDSDLTVLDGLVAVTIGGETYSGHAVVRLVWQPSAGYEIEVKADLPQPVSEVTDREAVIDFMNALDPHTRRSILVDPIPVRLEFLDVQPTLFGGHELRASGRIERLHYEFENPYPVQEIIVTWASTRLLLDSPHEIQMPDRRAAVTNAMSSATLLVEDAEVTLESLATWNWIEWDRERFAEEAADSPSPNAFKQRDWWLITSRAVPGHTFTMVGRVRVPRKLGGSEARSWVQVLGWLTVLGTGLISFPVRVDSLDHDGSPVKVDYEPLVIEAPRSVQTWWPASGVSSRHLEQPLREMRSILADTEGAWLTDVITWYATALGTRDDKSSLMITQSALELLAWVHLVRERSMSPDGFKKMHAADKIRLVLQSAGLTTDLPVWASELRQSRTSKGGDAVTAYVECRNSVVHPPRGEAPRPTDLAGVQAEASRLGVEWVGQLLAHRLKMPTEPDGPYSATLTSSDTVTTSKVAESE